MSRDRLAAMRAQQAAQAASQQQPYASQQGNEGNPGRYGRLSYEQSYEQPQQSYYPQQQGQQSFGQSAYSAYSGGRDDDENEGEDEDSRGQRARDQRRRRPSQSAAAYEQEFQGGNSGYYGYDNEQEAIPPVPAPVPAPAPVRQQRQQQQPQQQRHLQQQYQQYHDYNNQQYQQYSQEPTGQIRHDQYGQMGDESAYWEKNASQLALNNSVGSSTLAGSRGPSDHKMYPKKQKSLTAYQTQPEQYEIPDLPRSDQQYGGPGGYGKGPSPKAQSYASTPQQTPQQPSNAPQISMTDFFDELGSVRQSMKELERYIGYLDQLHSRNLNGNGGEDTAYELEQCTADTRQLTGDIRGRIKALEETIRVRTHGQAENDRQTRKVQIYAVKEKYVEMIQSYQTMEMRFRDKAKQRIERQYQIVNPSASPEEVRSVVESGQEVQIFAQALRQTTRVADARGVLNEVQSRHEDIKKIERTMLELFQLIQDMATMVEEQDEQFVQIEAKAEEVAKDMEIGNQEITKAVVSAKSARKKRKICCLILVLLLLVIGGVIAYVVVKIILPKVQANKAASSTTTNAKSSEDNVESSSSSSLSSSSTPRPSSTFSVIQALALPAASGSTRMVRERSSDADPGLRVRGYLFDE